VHHWRLEGTTKVGLKRHQLSAGIGHALISPVESYTFKMLGVTAALWEHGLEWMPIHTEPNVSSFEPEHGVESERQAYNDRLRAMVLRTKRTVRGEHAGYSDLFVPVIMGKKVVALLVTGPFALGRPSSEDILARWKWLTGRAGHPADPEFASYLAATLATLVLDGGKVAIFERLLECLARLMAGEGDAEKLANLSQSLRSELELARFVERTWDKVREIVDDRSSRGWRSVRINDANLRYLGLPRTADGVLAGLIVGGAAGDDPVDEALRRDAFQRRSVELAHGMGGAVAGRIGDHGIVFLSGTGPHRKKQRLADIAQRASALARKEYKLSLHFGAGIAAASEPLSRTYQAALGAAETALAHGISFVLAETGERGTSHSLRHLRQELGRAVADRPQVLGARFDRYLEAVAAHSGYQLEVARGHLDAGFERMAGPLIGTGLLDEKSFGALCETLDRASSQARTVSELFAAYRRASADVSQAVTTPVTARRERSLRRAVEFVHEHYAEPLPRDKVARIAGIAPDYFSKLFRERERTTFERFVQSVRLERAKQLLSNTGLGVGRVAEMSGFNSSAYFCRVFRRAVGKSPVGYREASRLRPVRRASQSTKQTR
jgi:AraC-like DNA-binding protein